MRVAILLLVTLPSVFAHDPITTKVTWEREIAPIIQARCVSCHSPGGAAPMPLTTYAEARPWARAIREEVLTRRMPKWQVVRGYGDFWNDPSLSPFEIALITAWADGGAPASAKASASAKATADKAADTQANTTASEKSDAAGTARPTMQPHGEARRRPATSRNVTIPCASRALPGGRLVAIRPLLTEGASLRLTILRPDGSEEPLLGIRGFDPDFAETYWIRNPISAAPGTRLVVAGASSTHDTCSVTLFFE
jgi:hypothetical protein